MGGLDGLLKRNRKKKDKSTGDGGNGHQPPNVTIVQQDHGAEIQRLTMMVEKLTKERAAMPMDPQSRVHLANLLVDTPEQAQRRMSRISRRQACLFPSFEIIGYSKTDEAYWPKHDDGTPMTLREIWLNRALIYTQSIQGKHVDRISDLAEGQTGRDDDTPDHMAISR